MIRKRYGTDSGWWHVDIFDLDEWVEVSAVPSEDEASELIRALERWRVVSR